MSTARFGPQPEDILDTKPFWEITIGCLVQFHNMDIDRARERVVNFRAQLGQLAPPEIQEDVRIIIYHEEPFYVACGLTRKRLDLLDYQTSYQEIRTRHGW